MRRYHVAIRLAGERIGTVSVTADHECDPAQIAATAREALLDHAVYTARGVEFHGDELAEWEA